MRIVWKGPLLSRTIDVSNPEAATLRSVLSADDVSILEGGTWFAWDKLGEGVGLDTMIHPEETIEILPKTEPETFATGAFLWSLMAIAAIIYLVVGPFPRFGPFGGTP